MLPAKGCFALPDWKSLVRETSRHVNIYTGFSAPGSRLEIVVEGLFDNATNDLVKLVSVEFRLAREYIQRTFCRNALLKLGN